MKRAGIVWSLMFTAVLFFSTAASATITLVQHTQKDQSSAVTSTTLAYVSNVAVNNLLVTVVRGGAAGGLTSITTTDTIGNTWTKGTFQDVAGIASLQISWAVNISSAADTVTITPSASATLRIAIYEYSGTATTSPLDAQNNNTTGTSAAPAAGSITPAANNELVIGAVCVNNTRTFTAGTNFTLEDQVPAAPNTKLGVEDWIQTTAMATTAPQTLSASDTWLAAIATFKPAVASGPPHQLTTIGCCGMAMTVDDENFFGFAGCAAADSGCQQGIAVCSGAPGSAEENCIELPLSESAVRVKLWRRTPDQTLYSPVAQLVAADTAGQIAVRLFTGAPLP